MANRAAISWLVWGSALLTGFVPVNAEESLMLRPEVRRALHHRLARGFAVLRVLAVDARGRRADGGRLRRRSSPIARTEAGDGKGWSTPLWLPATGSRRITKVSLLFKTLAAADPYAHVHAAESLYKLGEVGDGQVLTQAMNQTANVKLSLMAAGALARHGDAAALVLIRSKVNDDSADAVCGGVAAVPPGRRVRSRRLAAQCPAPADHARGVCLSRPLACLGDPVGLERLEKNLSDKSPEIRTYAAENVGHAYATRLADRLTQMLADPGLDVRLRASQSLIVLAQPRQKLTK